MFHLFIKKMQLTVLTKLPSESYGTLAPRSRVDNEFTDSAILTNITTGITFVYKNKYTTYLSD